MNNFIDNDSISEIAIDCDISGKILEWNRAGSDITFYSDDEVVGKDIKTLFTVESGERLGRIIEFVKAGSTFPTLGFEIVIKNGQVVPVDVSITPKKSAKEEIVGFTFLIRDVTLRELLQDKYNRLNALYRTLVEQSPSMIYLLDEDGKIIFINETGTEMLGYTKEELIGKELMEFVYPEDREDKYWNIRERRSVPARSTWNVELRLVPKHKKMRKFEFDFIYVSLNSFGVYAEKSVGKKSKKSFVGTQGIARDITELKVLKKFASEVQGILPICSSCYRIRTVERGKEKWMPIESYISLKGGPKFSHTICPDCMRGLKFSSGHDSSDDSKAPKSD